jgi:hypothetical protein
MRIVEGCHVGFLENEVMFGIEFQPQQYVRIERHFLDLVDQFEQDLVLRVLPDDVTGFLHRTAFEDEVEPQ